MYLYDTDKLKEKMEEKGITFDDLSSKLSIDRSTLYRRLNTGKLLIRDMQIIQKALNLSDSEAKEIFLSKKSH